MRRSGMPGFHFDTFVTLSIFDGAIQDLTIADFQ
jgi:hypothetical protein